MEQALPGGYTVGEKVFFMGASQTYPNGNKVVWGQQGEVTGPGDGQKYKGKGVQVIFPGNTGVVSCFLNTVSRDKPPLPGGYKVGEKVFFTWTSQTFVDGDKLVHGQQGEVTGPGTGKERDTHIAVFFPGNKGSIECWPTQVSRDAPPPPPGGYKVGEKVFFTGESQTISTGDNYVHGQQGEVTGPATNEALKGNGVCVLFPGNKHSNNCWLTTVSRCDPKAAAKVSRCDPKAAAKVAALGLLQPLEALSLDADTLLTATAAAVAYCDAQGAGSIADLVECDLLDGLMAALALKPVQAKRLSASLKGPAAAAQAVASGGSGDIFASYKQNDGGDALLMNMYHSLKPLDVWLDKMRGEERSEAGMVAGVKACRLFCAVISPAYFQSAFCLLEMRTALQQEKKIAVCYNGSKYKVQEALGWIPTDFAHLKNEELIKLDEDMEYMVVGLGKLKQRL